MSTRLLAGRYELIEKIGEGGMAVVYKGKDRLLNRFVAIKILRPEYIKDEQFIKNFIHESQAAAGLTHPNIVAVYDVGREGDIYYIVMELAEGITLSEYIRKNGKIEYHEAIQIIRQVCLALETAHSKQLVHRDVKPHNIIMTDQGVKLADFGIAKAVSAATIVGGSDKVMGSVHYFSPEQARGAYVDERSDIYSLGIVLYEMLTGKVPFDGDNAVSIALMHINDPMPAVDSEVKNLPPQLGRIISKCTEKYQIKRYRNVSEIIEELDNISFISNVIGEKAFTIGRTPEQSEQKAQQPAKNNDRDAEKPKKTSRTEERKKKEKEQKEKKTNFANKGTTAFIIGAGAVVIIACIIILGFVLGWFGGKTQEIPTPNFIGMTFEQAEEEAAAHGLVLSRGADIYSPDQEEGFVTSQAPQADTIVSEGKTITIYVSKGMRAGVIPKVIGLTQSEADELLRTFNFVLGNVTVVDGEEKKGTIISQSVDEGSPADAGTRVDVEISNGEGPAPEKVPNLLNKTPEEATVIIEESGFKVGDVTYEEVNDVVQNIVISQDPEVDSKLKPGEKISIVVSKGEMPEGAGNGEDVVEEETEEIVEGEEEN